MSEFIESENGKYSPESNDSLDRHVQAIGALHAKAQKQAGQRLVDRFTNFVARPGFFYCILVVLNLWIVINWLGKFVGFPSPDPPPFSWLQGVASVGALLMTIGIFISQRRAASLSDQRMLHALHLNMLSEEKLAKIVSLIEELRRDLPNVKNREDLQAQAMTQPADPHQVSSALEDVLNVAPSEGSYPDDSER